MATQIEKVFVKKESDVDFTELEQVYNGDELVFQNTPIGYNYARIILTVTPSVFPNIWDVYNESQYTVVVGWSNGAVGEYAPNVMGQFPVGVVPIWIQVNGLQASPTGALDTYHYYADCPVSYKYLRNIYIE